MNKYFKYLIWPIALTPLAYLAMVWKNLPETIAMHFDLEGKPDRFGNKNELLVMVIILSVMSAALYFILANVYKIDPKKYAAENKDRLQRMGFIMGVFISALTCFIIYNSSSEGFEIKSSYIFAGVGLLYSVIGNYMHNIKPNYFAGFRLPWTLHSEENWRKTHLLGGKIWFVGGLVLTIVSLLLPSKTGAFVFFGLTAIMVLIPVVYSYRMFKAEKLLKK